MKAIAKSYPQLWRDELKGEHPEAIVFVENGDYFLAFGQDAQDVATFMRIMLSEHAIPACDLFFLSASLTGSDFVYGMPSRSTEYYAGQLRQATGRQVIVEPASQGQHWPMPQNSQA